MEKLGGLDYNNFIELLDYLESLSEYETEEETGVFVEEKIHSFFPNLDAVQEIELSYIISNRDKKLFEVFKQNNPEVEVDPTGQSVPKDRDYWQLTENALNSVYTLAKEDLESTKFIDKSYNKVNTQVYNAKNLNCLANMESMKYDSYLMHRKLFLDSSNIKTGKEFNELERKLTEIGVKPSQFLINVVKYCYKRKDDYSVFLRHLFDRIEVLHSDNELTSESNKSFLDSINTVIAKNNLLYD